MQIFEKIGNDESNFVGGSNFKGAVINDFKVVQTIALPDREIESQAKMCAGKYLNRSFRTDKESST